jgi:6-phospho-beta-glucosidase
MSQAIRLAVLGGSGVATPELIDAFAQAADRPALHVSLIGRDRAKLEAVGAMCRRLAGKAAPPITVDTHTDPRRGLEGADYVLNQIRVGGYAGRAFDETFPHEFGLPGEETFGPGGMNMALRTIPVVLELCSVVQEIAPAAWMVNLTNPSSLVQYAITRRSSLRVVSLCDLPMMVEQTIADLLGVSVPDVLVRYTGMNHFGWITGVRWQGRDVLPSVLEQIAAQPGLPVEPGIIRALGVIPTSYFKYLYHPNRMLAAQQGRRPRAMELLEMEAEIQAAYQTEQPRAKPASLVKRNAAWYQHMVVPFLLAHSADSAGLQVLQIRNDRALPFLPAGAIVEVPCVVRRNGLLPLAYDGGLPPELEALLLTNATFEMLWAEAVMEKSYPKALRAMLANHLVRDYDQAAAILKKIWPAPEHN